MVASLLESVIHTNDRIPCNSITVFHSRAVPNIKIDAYLARIQKFTPYNNDALLCILVYFDRISKLQPKFVLNSLNIHRLLIASIVVASKFTSDVFYPNARYAKVGGLPLVELNKLEMEFLFMCDFDLHVRLEAIQEYGDQLLRHSISNLVPLDMTTSSSLRKRRSPSSSSSYQDDQQRTCREKMTPCTVTNAQPSSSATTTSSTRYHRTNTQQQQHHVLLPLTPPLHEEQPEAKRQRREMRDYNNSPAAANVASLVTENRS
ncbi:hypothetical protein LRAMOSA04345 [Lichtheimia ramosa]|uniref:Cyclin n=1 Tax=Lichtheimia ramosa TaxID=688394 RepID=A0A077WY11_9FUNG|nr:hypothetical protein LRAMOSA04345 [Lichtheimia ramosa]